MDSLQPWLFAEPKTIPLEVSALEQTRTYAQQMLVRAASTAQQTVQPWACWQQMTKSFKDDHLDDDRLGTTRRASKGEIPDKETLLGSKNEAITLEQQEESRKHLEEVNSQVQKRLCNFAGKQLYGASASTLSIYPSNVPFRFQMFQMFHDCSIYPSKCSISVPNVPNVSILGNYARA